MYKLINVKTKEKTLCDKVTIDGFDYYVNDTFDDLGGWHIDFEYKTLSNPSRHNVVDTMKKVIATNNPNIDISKVVDEVEELADEYVKGQPIRNRSLLNDEWNAIGFVNGYKKSQETHPFSEEDVIEFNEWSKELLFSENSDWLIEKSIKELLQLWKEQQTKIIYYEN